MFKLHRQSQAIFCLLVLLIMVFATQKAKSQSIAQWYPQTPSSVSSCDGTDKLFLGGVIGAGVMLAVWVAYSVGSNKWK